MRIAIIGAGLSGLAAAQRLQQSGMSVDVYEKSRGTGGRLSTKRLDWASLDIGAQYFTARDARFQQAVDAWVTQGVAAKWPLSPHSIAGEQLVQLGDNESRFVGTPCMNSLAHCLAEGVTIRFNTRVAEVRRESSTWALHDEEGQCIAHGYDWLVSTLPAEQSRTLLADTQIAEGIPRDIHRPCWALGLATCGDVAPSVQGLFGDKTVSWVSRLASATPSEFARPQPANLHEVGFDDVWMLHFSSDWSLEHGKEAQALVAETGKRWLEKVLGDNLKGQLDVLESYTHYWRYARLSDQALSSAPENAATILVDVPHGLGVVGAWLAGGRVEGAYVSGIDMAETIIANEAGKPKAGG